MEFMPNVQAAHEPDTEDAVVYHEHIMEHKECSDDEMPPVALDWGLGSMVGK